MAKDTWHEMEISVDAQAKTAEVSVNGVSLGSFEHYFDARPSGGPIVKNDRNTGATGLFRSFIVGF